MNRLFLARTSDIGINRLLDSLALFEHRDMLGQQIPIKRIGVVEVDILTLLDRNVTTVLVVRVLGDNYHFALRKALNEFFDYRCFTRAGTARNADDKHNTLF